MGFLFDMVMVGLFFTLGVLIAKIALPNELFGAGRSKQEYFARAFGARPMRQFGIHRLNESSDSDEDMAM